MFRKNYRALFTIVAICSFLISQGLFAEILIEPYGGVFTGQFKVRTSSPTQTNESRYGFTGGGFGLRAGYTYKVLFATIDGFFSTINFNDDTEYSEKSPDNHLVGLTAGFNSLIWPFRIWAGYQFFDRLDDPRTDNSELKGYSYKFGAGWRIVRHVFVNFEYMKHRYSRCETNGNTTDYPITIGSITFEKPEIERLFLSLSFPLAF